MVEVPLTRGLVAVVDDDDGTLVVPYRWHARRGKNGVWYAGTNVRKPGGGWRAVKMHRLILDAPKGVLVDHRDGDGLNNRRANLRFATNAQNQQNGRKKGASSQFKGVTLCRWRRTRQWQAQIQVNGRKKNLGYFAEEEDAARAYDAAAREAFGEYARTNFGAEGAEHG